MKLVESLKGYVRRGSPSMYRWYLKYIGTKRHISQITEILNDPRPPTTLDCDLFSDLQDSYNQWYPDYKFDHYSTCRRAYERAIAFLENIESLRTPGKYILDLACGDGMSGTVLTVYGHSVTLLDYQDWRDQRASTTPFIQATLAQPIPIDSASFDFIFSFNAFEHIPDPALALNEAVRILRPGGYIWLDFNPLYCSPLGLHAFRFRMPYPQFLFSEDIIQTKLKELGVHDLGSEQTDLQPLNRWRVSQFERIWNREDCEIISIKRTVDARHLTLVTKYPQAFRGRNLTIEDLTTSGIFVLLHKK